MTFSKYLVEYQSCFPMLSKIWKMVFSFHFFFPPDCSLIIPIPVLRRIGSRVVDIACGHEHSLACDANGRAWAWGHPNYGQLGTGSNGSFIKVRQIFEAFVAKQGWTV